MSQELEPPDERRARVIPGWLRQLLLSEKVCIYCLTQPPDVVDHIVPVYAGGLATPSNLIGACGRCNAEKGARDISQWFGDIGLALQKSLTSREINRPIRPTLKPKAWVLPRAVCPMCKDERALAGDLTFRSHGFDGRSRICGGSKMSSQDHSWMADRPRWTTWEDARDTKLSYAYWQDR